MDDLQLYIDLVVKKAKVLKGVSFRLPYGPDVMSLEVAGKQFGLIDLSKEWHFYNLKCSPELSVKLRGCFSGIRPGYHMNKVHWISVDFEGDCPLDLQALLIKHACFQTLKGLTGKAKTQVCGSIEAFNEKYEKSVRDISGFLEKYYV